MLTLRTQDNSGAADAAPETARLPATLAQQRFWVLDQLDPGSPALNVAVRWRIEGELAAAFVEKAFEQIIARHQPLRTSFVEEDGEPVQLVHTKVDFRISSIDLTVLSAEAAQAEADDIAQVEARRSFNILVAPLIHVTHIQVRPQLAVVLVTAHHLVCDGWSIGLIANEFGRICDALQSGRPADLPELPLTYGDFSRWQREFVASGGLQREFDFWSHALDGIEYFALQADRPRRAKQPTPGAIRSVLLERRLSDGLAGLARRNGCTMFMGALAVLLTVLHRYSGAPDIVVGTQVAGRQFVEVEKLVGLFINTLVLRVDLDGDPDFRSLLKRVRAVVADSLEYESMPLEKIIEILKPKRYPGHNTILSTNFIFQRSFVENADYEAFRLIDIPSYSAGAMYDLNFFMVERPEGWRASCEFNTTLYDEITVSRLLDQFRNVLESAVAEPSLPLSKVSVLSQSERDYFVAADMQTHRNYLPLTLPEMFDRQVAKTPAATAVIDQGQALTYEYIQRRSTGLAAALLDNGVRPGSRVGVFVRRSADLVIAPLGVMKAGCVYVPLDPIYPEGRIAQIIEQSDMAAIVSDLDEGPVQRLGIPIIPVAAMGSTATELPAPGPEDTAYIIYTSGSTGQPKGVQIRHCGLSNFLFAMQERPGFGQHDTIMALATICFDISILELFLPLVVGATVVIADQETVRDGRLLLACIQRFGVRVLQATPTTWRMLIEAGWTGTPRLRMLCGGEALAPDLASQLLARSPELWNMYGPTETTIWSAVQQIEPDRAVTIGPPISNTQFYVVDKNDEFVPQGAVGELLIGGHGVAVGYWGKPDETRDRFIPDTFQGRPDRNVYRTGDLVRRLADGSLQFLGRKDNQVKLRGYRIELAEIESVILGYPEVRNAVAVVAEEAGAEPALAAFVELSSCEPQREGAVLEGLRRHLGHTLPAYMRPRFITCVEAIPRLPNGKIDRKTLQRAGRKDVTAGPPGPPKTAIEGRLRDVWCTVLGVDSVQDSDDFFDLGGHSLLAARLLARVESAFGCRINLAALFDAPTFGAFKALVQVQDQRQFDFRQIVKFPSSSSRRALFAINNTGIYFTLSRRLKDALPVIALQLFDPAFPKGPLPETIEEIAQQYVQLILRLQPVGPYEFLGWCNGGVLAFEIACQLQAAGHVVDRVMVVDTWVPGYMRQQTWLRAQLSDLAFRMQLVLGDWRDFRAGRKNLRRFFLDRKMIRQIFGIKERVPATDVGSETAEQYDRWLVTYLDRAIVAYRPSGFAGKMTVFRSENMPTGWLLDPKLGWESIATGGVDLVVVPGDHYTAFLEPGVSAISRHIVEVSTLVARTPTRHSPSPDGGSAGLLTGDPKHA